jgi:uncharacterized protein (DUF1499 family)
MTNRSPALFSNWSPRIALFSGALIVTAALLHRLLGMPTPLALNLFLVGFVLATLAFLLGAISIGDVWRRGADGGGWAVIGMVIAATVFAWPLAFVPTYLNTAHINDATTDLSAPPDFQALAQERRRAGVKHPAQHPGGETLELQKASYPDIRPLSVTRSAEETYELALEALKRLRFQIVAETPPRGGDPGTIEAVDRTTLIGFYDDVVVRISNQTGRSRVDVRSASRFGTHDLGRNATRVRRVLAEVQGRLDASVSTPSQRFARIKSRLDKAKPQVKQGKAGNRNASDRRRGPDGARSGAQRAPAQKARPPG